MPFNKDVSDKLPDDPKQTIWRFTDLTRFIDLLATEELWFSCVEEFAKTDPWEGEFPTRNMKVVEAELLRQFHGMEDVARQGVKTYKNFIVALRKATYANCWHWNDYESAAMWSLYVPKDGIAIKSTVERLQRSLAKEPRAIRISEIRYLDFDKEDGDVLRTYLQKRMSFVHEKELRAFFTDPDLWFKFNTEQSKIPHEIASRISADVARIMKLSYVKGIRVKIDPKILIEQVLIAPTSQNALEEVVKDVMRKYSLSVPVSKSSITELPT